MHKILLLFLLLSAFSLLPAQSVIVPMLPSLPPTTTWIVKTTVQTFTCPSNLPALHVVWAEGACVVGPYSNDPVSRIWSCNSTHVTETIYEYQNCTSVQQVNAYERNACVGPYSIKEVFTCDTIGGEALVQKYGAADPGAPVPTVATTLYRNQGNCNSTSNEVIYVRFAVRECFGFSGNSYLRGCSDTAYEHALCDSFCQVCGNTTGFRQTPGPGQCLNSLYATQGIQEYCLRLPATPVAPPMQPVPPVSPPTAQSSSPVSTKAPSSLLNPSVLNLPPGVGSSSDAARVLLPLSVVAFCFIALALGF